MAPTARFCGFPQPGPQARTRRNCILESCKGDSTLPPEPFGHLNNQRDTHCMNTLNRCGSAFGKCRTDALFQNLQLITGLLSSTVNLQPYQKPIGY